MISKKRLYIIFLFCAGFFGTWMLLTKVEHNPSQREEDTTLISNLGNAASKAKDEIADAAKEGAKKVSNYLTGKSKTKEQENKPKHKPKKRPSRRKPRKKGYIRATWGYVREHSKETIITIVALYGIYTHWEKIANKGTTCGNWLLEKTGYKTKEETITNTDTPNIPIDFNDDDDDDFKQEEPIETTNPTNQSTQETQPVIGQTQFIQVQDLPQITSTSLLNETNSTIPTQFQPTAQRLEDIHRASKLSDEEIQRNTAAMRSHMEEQQLTNIDLSTSHSTSPTPTNQDDTIIEE